METEIPTETEAEMREEAELDVREKANFENVQTGKSSTCSLDTELSVWENLLRDITCKIQALPLFYLCF